MSEDMRYPVETLDPDEEDDGTMPANVEVLREHVVGHRIALAEQNGSEFVITLDDGRSVRMVNTDDCCAVTEIKSFLLNPSSIDHVITGVGTTDGYTTWHIYADMGDVLQLRVNWSAGNPFYYGYGFYITVAP